ncbi:MAG: sulfur carrier protein ThiS [Nitrospirota bacterium]
MNIVVNGEMLEVSEGVTLLALLSQLNIAPAHVAIELNLSVIDKSQFDQVLLKDSDKMEIIRFVGGG